MNMQQLIQVRHHIHQNPEAAFQEYNTRDRITQFLLDIGVDQKNIHQCAQSGLYVNLYGSSESQQQQQVIALRSELDALVMQENNEQLSYQSVNGKAHMCGHDGHIVSLLGFAMIFQKNAHKIPRSKCVRLLFQPAEEYQDGAQSMIRDNALLNVSEVYGYHNWPTAKIGQLWIKEGVMMAEVQNVMITFTGKGGHASEPNKFQNPIYAAVRFIEQISLVFKELQTEQKRLFNYSWTCFNAGSAVNTIADNSVIKGTFRILEVGLNSTLLSILSVQSQLIAQSFGCSANLQDIGHEDLTINTPEETQHVIRVGKKYFGDLNVNAGPTPVYASEDFGCYTKICPGAFIFLSSGCSEQNNPMLHQSNFNFNDDLIEVAAQFWWHLIQDRFAININDEVDVK